MLRTEILCSLRHQVTVQRKHNSSHRLVALTDVEVGDRAIGIAALCHIYEYILRTGCDFLCRNESEVLVGVENDGAKVRVHITRTYATNWRKMLEPYTPFGRDFSRYSPKSSYTVALLILCSFYVVILME